jgi:hypothetical protein
MIGDKSPSPSAASQASRVHQTCTLPHTGHLLFTGLSGSAAKLRASVSMPVGTARPVLGHRIIIRPMATLLPGRTQQDIPRTNAAWSQDAYCAVQQGGPGGAVGAKSAPAAGAPCGRSVGSTTINTCATPESRSLTHFDRFDFLLLPAFFSAIATACF